MLYAYFDESGTHAGSAQVAIGGIIADENGWAAFDQRWRQELERYQVPAFHSVDCERGEGDFMMLRDAPLRIRAMLDFAQVLCDCDVKPVSVQADVNAWNAYLCEYLKRRFITPYHFVLEYLIQRVCEWSKIHRSGEPVEFVFATHPEYQDRAALVAAIYQSSPHSTRSSQMEGLRFEPARSTPRLQAADLFAREAYKHASSPSIRRPPLELIFKAKGNFIGGFLTRTSFEDISARAQNPDAMIVTPVARDIAGRGLAVKNRKQLGKRKKKT